MMRLQNKTALVTGAGRGIGRAIAVALAQAGAYVAACDLDTGDSLAAIQAAGGRGQAFTLDVTDKARIQQVVEQVGRVDILVNNAGIYEVLSIAEISEAQWDRVLAVNLKGTFLCSQAVMGQMKERGQGRIINMASSAGKTGGVLSGAHYAASKAGIICFTKSLAREMGPYGVTVNAVSPGRIDTPMIKAAPAEENEAIRLQTPLQQIGQPEDVAQAVLFLASEEARFITGEILDVNGGLLMD